MSEPVIIPPTLIERLQGLGPHFIRVAKRGKNPVDTGWTLKPMTADNPTLVTWLAEGGNYGVIGGYGLVILDADIDEIKERTKIKLPPTFTVESPGSKGWHCYFLCGLEKPIRLRDKEGENVGDVQGHGKMVVGPCSIHPNGQRYRIVSDVPLAQITKEQLVEALGEYIVAEREVQLIEELARRERQQTKADLNISQVISLAGLGERGGEYFGPHPVHGSKTGQNFWVNPAKNVWHCFRHGTGGGPLLWLAVEEGIIKCEEAGIGALRGDLFKKVLQRAEERGLIPKARGRRIGVEDETVYRNGNHTIVPDLGNRFRIVHPAIDYVDDTTLIGIWLPCNVTTPPKREGGEEKNTVEYRLFFITSDRQMILASEEELAEHRWLFTHEPFAFHPHPRWQPAKFLKGELSPTPRQAYQAIYDEIARYMDLTDPRHYAFITLYFMGTYFFHVFECFPYLYIGGTKRSGKTKLLTLAKQVCFNAEFSTSITDASLFRMIQNSRATLLIDENEKLQDSERATSFRALLLGGFMNESYAHRVEEDSSKKRRPRGFELYSPKIIANISGIEDVLADRCIPLTLLRGLDQNKLNLWPNSKAQAWSSIRNMLYVLALTESRTTCATYATCDAILEERGIHSRQKLLWLPIIAMAKLVDGDGDELTNMMLSLAKDIERSRIVRDTTENTDAIIVQILYGMCQKDDHYYIKDVKEELVKAIGEEKRGRDGSISYEAPRWLSNDWVGRALRRLGFEEGHRVGGGPRQIRIVPKKVEELVRRLSIETTTPKNSGTSGSSGTSGTVSAPLLDEGNVPSNGEVDSYRAHFVDIPGIVNQLRYLLPKRFIESDFVAHAIKLNLSEEEATKLFQKLVDEGRVGRDPDGFWQWM